MNTRLLASVLALVVLSGCAGDGSDGLTLGGWERIAPGGETRCARGGAYAFWVRQGDPRKLLVFFQGGGGCFDVTTCAPGSPWFDDRVDASDDPGLAGEGILELDNADNPLPTTRSSSSRPATATCTPARGS